MSRQLADRFRKGKRARVRKAPLRMRADRLFGRYWRHDGRRRIAGPPRTRAAERKAAIESELVAIGLRDQPMPHEGMVPCPWPHWSPSVCCPLVEGMEGCDGTGWIERDA